MVAIMSQCSRLSLKLCCSALLLAYFSFGLLENTPSSRDNPSINMTDNLSSTAYCSGTRFGAGGNLNGLSCCRARRLMGDRQGLVNVGYRHGGLWSITLPHRYVSGEFESLGHRYSVFLCCSILADSLAGRKRTKAAPLTYIWTHQMMEMSQEWQTCTSQPPISSRNVCSVHRHHDEECQQAVK